MKYLTKFTTRVLLAVIMALSFTACDNDDDLEEIFTGKNWNLTFIQNGTERLVPQQEGYTLIFSNADFVFTTPNAITISGNWYADGESRSFGCNEIVTSGDIENDAVAKAALNILRNSAMYNGDANWIQIVEQPGNIYMQFYNR